MNKKLMALAVTGALFAPAAAMAQASNVVVYGIMDVDLQVVSATGSTAGNSIPSREKVDSNSSRLGFRGEEPLGNGMSAWFQIESGINGDGSGSNGATLGSALGSRNTGVGLKGSWGTMLYGLWDTPLKVSTVGLDPFGDVGIAAYCSVLCGPSFNLPLGNAGLNTSSNISSSQPFDTRAANSVQYWSPNWSGFSGRLQYSANEGKSNSNVPVQLNPYEWSASVSYAGGPWYLSYAYQRYSDSGAMAAGHETDHDGRAAVSYVWNALTATAIYDSQDYSNGTTGATYHRNAWMGLFTYVIGPNTLRAFYIHANNATGSSAFAGPNTGANSFALGWGYALSKRTEVYTLYTAIDNHSAAAYDFGSNPIGVKSGGAAFVGASPKGGLLGIKHVF